MRDRRYKGAEAFEDHLLETNPTLGEHVRDGRIIRTGNDYLIIEEARARMEERSGQRVLKSQGKITGEPEAGVQWWRR